MNKIMAVTISLLLFIPFASINGNNVALTNNANGNVLYVGGSGPNNYTSIQEAINDAGNGYTIYVYQGNYNESIVINKSISLIGIEKNGEKPVIDGGGRKFAISITADGCTVGQLEIINHGNFSDWPPEKWGFGIEVSSNNNLIENNTVSCNWVSIRIYSSYNTVANNAVSNATSSGINLWGGNNTIIYNNISNNPSAVGIDLSSSNNTISWNVIRNNFHGVDVWGNNNTISYNTVCNNRQYGVTVGPGSYNKILYNKICNNGHDGVLIAASAYTSAYNVIAYNNISLNGWRGIYLLGNWPYLSNNTIYRNTISYNGKEGIYLYWMCKDNNIEENNFIGNAGGNAGFHLFDRSYRNTWQHNYWGDWRFKFPRPIFGSVEEARFFHRWLNFDKHPAIQPYGNFTYKNMMDRSYASKEIIHHASLHTSITGKYVLPDDMKIQ